MSKRAVSKHTSERFSDAELWAMRMSGMSLNEIAKATKQNYYSIRDRMRKIKEKR